MLRNVRQFLDPTKWRYLWAGVRKRVSRPKCCPCCGAADSVRLDRKLIYTFERCRGCGICFKHPAESGTEMERYYQEEYGRNETRLSRRIPEDAELERLLATRFAGTMLDFTRVIALLQALGVPPGGRVLDFGASWGYGTWQLRQAGFDAEGFEISRPRADFAARLGVQVHHELPDARPGFDAIYSSHVLEHVPNPLASLQEQLRLTRADGYVIAHTPNGCAAFQRANPALFHLLWGLHHPVLLSDEFIRKNWPRYPSFLSSGEDRHVPVSLAEWNRQDDFTDNLTQPELLLVLHNAAR